MITRRYYKLFMLNKFAIVDLKIDENCYKQILASLP